MKILKKSTICFLTIIALTFAITACGGDDDPPQQAAPPTTTPTPQQDHEHTFTAFGKTVRVTGDKAIPKADFDEAAGKVEEAMVTLEAILVTNLDVTAKFEDMVKKSDFLIAIKTGDAAPVTIDGKTMTIGNDYLKTNDVVPTIRGAILSLVNSNAFASRSTKITMAFGEATVKSDDSFTDTEWNTHVADVKAGIEAAYDANPLDSGMFKSVFAAANGAEVILLRNGNKIEIKDGEWNRMYIRVDSIDSVNYKTAAMCMDSDTPWQVP